jgi:hypothetical protein
MEGTEGATHKHGFEVFPFWEYPLIANLMHLRVETANLRLLILI